MARPKNDPNTKPARERIIDAFWILLDKGSYHDITIQSLSIEAKVNHNTFYYHFDSIDSLAKTAFLENLDSDISRKILRMMFEPNVDTHVILENPDFISRGNKAKLFTRGDSTYLLCIFKESIMSAWLNAIGITIDKLSAEDRMDLDFIFSGLTTIIGQTIDPSSTIQPAKLFQHELGVGILATLNRLKTTYSL